MRLFLTKILVIIIAMCGVTTYSVLGNDNVKYREIDSKYRNATLDKLYGIATAFANNNTKDSALIYYSLIYNRTIEKQDTKSLLIISDALNEAAKIYFVINDYKSALNLWLKMLAIAEETNDEEDLRAAYNNIAGIHFTFGEYNMAKRYYKIAYERGGNKRFKFVILNNLGAITSQERKFDSAMYYFRMAQKYGNDSIIYNTANNIGEVFRKMGMPDSALFYYRMGISNARKYDLTDMEAKVMSNLGKFYFMIGKIDSAEYYIDKSNRIAEQHNVLDILSDNYLYNSKIAEKNGNKSLALEFYKKYSTIRDSLFDTSKYRDINKLQFMYDMNKVDKQLQVLSTEQEINLRTIKLQRTVQLIMLIAFLIVTITLIYIYIQKKRLDKSYDVLVEKNIEIVDQDKSNQRLKEDYERIISQLKSECAKSEIVEPIGDATTLEKSKRHNIDVDLYNDIKTKILNVMKNDPIIYSHEFSLSKLSEMVGSNQTYVSQIINESFGKNFKPFVNSYRIKEALRLIQDPESKKYTIESISMRVGFESRSSFNMVFKEITGVTPSFYTRSLSRKDKK